jgi:hypothetical protein
MMIPWVVGGGAAWLAEGWKPPEAGAAANDGEAMKATAMTAAGAASHFFMRVVLSLDVIVRPTSADANL